MRGRGTLSILAASCMFGLGTVLAKLLGEAFNPFMLSWFALFCGGLCIAALQFVRHQPLWPHLTRRGWLDILLLASLGTALPLLMIVIGLPQTSAITGNFLLQSQGPAATILAVLFLKEKMRWKQLVGMALLIAGSLLVILRTFSGSLQISGGEGDLLVLVAALGLGFSYIPSKRLAPEAGALQVILLRLLVGSLFLLPFLPFQHSILQVPLTPILLTTLVLYIITSFCLGYLFQQLGLSILQAWESAALMQTLPLFGTVCALLILRESITPLQIAGGCVILLGGLLVI